jgi:hypothetical protein
MFSTLMRHTGRVSRIDTTLLNLNRSLGSLRKNGDAGDFANYALKCVSTLNSAFSTDISWLNFEPLLAFRGSIRCYVRRISRRLSAYLFDLFV